MKVLFVAGGRRVSLGQKFIEHGFEVFGYETETNCPLSLIGTVIPGLTWNDPKLEEHLLATIEKCEIDLVIPLADKATSVLSRLVAKNPELHNKIPTSSEKTNNICLNKKNFEREFWDQEYYPRVIEGYPVICKPIFGNSSKGIEKISWEQYISNKPYWEENFVCQRLVPGNMEVSVDCFFNKSGQLVGSVPRHRIEVSGGEICRGITLSKNVYGLDKLVKEVGERIGLIGPSCIQFMIENNKNPFIEEVNSRCGGGLTMSIAAGFDVVKLMKEEYLEGKEIIPGECKYKEGFGMVRYMKDYFYEKEV